MFFWAGGPLSWLRYTTLWSFRKLHPDWEMTLFYGGPSTHEIRWQTGERADFAEAIAGDYLPKVKTLGVKLAYWQPPPAYIGRTPIQWADMCRWGALSKFGGWFFDLDMLFVDSMASLIDSPAYSDVDGDVAFVPARDWMPTGFIGAKAGNQFTSTLYSAALEVPDRSRFHAAGGETILRLIGLEGRYSYSRQNVTRRMATAFPQVKFTWLSHAVAYRWEWFDACKIWGEDHGVMNSTIAVHWYGSQRISQKFNRLLDEHNFRQHSNTVCHFMRDLSEAEIFG
jgi:hypothetical protein